MDVEEKHVVITESNKAERRFRRLFLWISMTLLATLILFMVFPKNLAGSGLALGKSFSMEQSTFVYATNKRYSNRTYRLGFYVSDNQLDPLTEMQSKVRTKSGDNGQKLKSSVVQVSPDFYIVTVKAVPNKQALLYLVLGDSKAVGDGLNATSSQGIAINKVINAGKYKQPTAHQMQQEYFNYMVKFYELKIQKYQKLIKQANANIATLKQTKAKQKQSLTLQTGTQKANTKAKITQTNSAIQQRLTEIKSYNKSLDNARTARANYQQKLYS